MQVTLYEGLKAPHSDILEFLDSLEFVPAQHDPRWSQVYAELDNEDFYISVARENGKIVGISNFTVFTGPMGPILHANPYMGYGGCSCVPGRQHEVIRSLMTSLLEWARDYGCITVSVATPPFSEELSEAYIGALNPDHSYRNLYQYNYLDRHPIEDLNCRRRQRILNQVRQAECLEIELGPPDSASQVEAWLDLYEARYAQIGAPPLPRAFRRAIWSTFSSVGKAELWLAQLNGHLLGGGLFVIGRGIVDYFSTAWSTEGMKSHAHVLMVYKSLSKFVEAGLKRFNWQSSPSRDSGVTKFKTGWGALESEHLILTKVLGDARVFTSRPLGEVRDAYGLHFVLPYSLWERK